MGAIGRAGFLLKPKSCDPGNVWFVAGADPLLEGPAGKRYAGRAAYMGSVLCAGNIGTSFDIWESCILAAGAPAVYNACALDEAIGSGENWLPSN